MEDFFLDISYKNKTVRFKVVNPEAPLATLMDNLRHSIGEDGRLIFDFPSIDQTGAPLDYFFGKEDPQVHEIRVLRPRIGREDQKLADYNVNNCIGCNSCFTREGNKCFQNDDIVQIYEKLRNADTVAIASPEYF